MSHVISVVLHHNAQRVVCSCPAEPLAYIMPGESITLDRLTELAHDHIVAAEGPSPETMMEPDADYVNVGDPEPYDPMCLCGHPKSEHGANGVCIVKGDGRRPWADSCTDFDPA